MEDTLFKNLLTSTLRSEGYLVINKLLIKRIGIVPSILLSFYIEEYHKKEEEWFSYPHNSLQQELDLSTYQIREAKKTLIKLKLIKRKTAGIPAKELFNINFPAILLIINDINLENPEEMVQAQLSESQTSSHLQYINIKNKKSINTSTLFGEKESNNINPKKRRRRTFSLQLSQFNDFWEIYPNKSSKGRARVAWEKLSKKKDAPTFSELRRAITRQKGSERWKKGVIPYPSTWLNNFGWIDDVSTLTVPKNGTEKKEMRYRGEKIVYKKAEKI